MDAAALMGVPRNCTPQLVCFITADELAAASGLAMGKTSRVPAVVIRGYKFEAGESKATEMIRPKEEDLFP